ncbi:MAG TPA: phage portal protein, partial [Gemmata sp.]|nr:phage portal protein [Gemmata sp.]
MKNSTTWLDRLRSRLTGQPAKFYAKRRIAKADLHALEEQRARAVARLTEDIELIDRYVNPLERYMDGDRLLTPFGTILDRRSGKNLPLVWTELDLREFRRWARVICDFNTFAVGFLGLLTDFHIRQGFGWQVVRSQGTGIRSQEYSSTSSLSPELALIQEVLDEWRDCQQWGLRSREAFRRWRRDGEVFLRFFRGGRETQGLPVIRFVEPEQVGPPPGDDPDDRWSFGILTDPEDVEDVQAYFVRDPLGTGSEGDEVPAHRILHLKANVDSSIRRGLPDFLPVQDDLERVRRMLRNMGEVAAIQTAIAWVSQYVTATVDQVGTLIRAGSDYTRPKLGDPSGKLMDVVNYEPGTVIHMDNNRQFLAGPVGTGTAGFIQVEQAILRGCGARWRFPEYFSGDASNNNMASSIVAGSPFVVAVEGNQLEWGVFERAVAKKVLELCVESGRLSREQVDSVDVKVTPPAVALANREEEERLREMRNKAGVLSVTTWQQQVGLDPKHEAANFEAEAKKKGAEGSGEKTVGESEDNCEC